MCFFSRRLRHCLTFVFRVSRQICLFGRLLQCEEDVCVGKRQLFLPKILLALARFTILAPSLCALGLRCAGIRTAFRSTFRLDMDIAWCDYTHRSMEYEYLGM